MEYVGLAGLRGENLGSYAWSREFARWIRGVLPPSVQQERDQWHAWWTIPYVVERVRAAGARGELPPRMVDAVLLLHLPPDEWRETAAAEPLSWYAEVLHRTKRGPDWLRAAERAVLRHVRRRYLPYDRPRRQAPAPPPASAPEESLAPTPDN